MKILSQMKFALPFLLMVGFTHAAPAIQKGQAGPFDTSVACEDMACKKAVFSIHHGKESWDSPKLACNMAPCGPDAITWHPTSSLISIALQDNDNYVLHINYKKGWSITRGSTKSMEKPVKIGSFTSVGSGFLSINDSKSVLIAKSEWSGKPFLVAYRVQKDGSLVEDREYTCAQADNWLSYQRNKMEETALGLKTQVPGKKTIESPHEKRFLELASYCNLPISDMARKEAEKWVIDPPKDVRSSDDFWSPTAR